MHYSLLIYQTPSQFADRIDPARRDALNQAFGRYVGALKDAGVLRTTLGIEPPDTTTTVRSGGDTPRVEAGPHADSKSQLGGVCVIEVSDHDAAIAWAKRAPFDHCEAIDLRPTRIVTSA
ncbi:MAG TPA: YciI family protein [Gemmatimonadaceae bacterium]|nr:YciI family protein [Gemmatimonadaceae bacterium]